MSISEKNVALVFLCRKQRGKAFKSQKNIGYVEIIYLNSMRQLDRL